MIEKKCLTCGKVFYVKPYRQNIAFYCSRSCSSKANYEKLLGNIDHSYLKGNQFRKGKKPTNSFEKGHVPWNKGIKGIHLNPKTEFKKGRQNERKAPIGTIIKRKEKGKARNFIKVEEPNKWKYYYVYLWECKNGKKKTIDKLPSLECEIVKVGKELVLKVVFLPIKKENLQDSTHLLKLTMNGKIILYQKTILNYVPYIFHHITSKGLVVWVVPSHLIYKNNLK